MNKQFIVLAILASMIVPNLAYSYSEPVTCTLIIENPEELSGLPVYLNLKITALEDGLSVRSRYSLENGGFGVFCHSEDQDEFFRTGRSIRTKNVMPDLVPLKKGESIYFRDYIGGLYGLQGDIMAAGRYKLKVCINLKHNDEWRNICSNVVTQTITEPLDLNKKALKVWKGFIPFRTPASDNINLLKELVKNYPKSRYADYARIQIAWMYYTNKKTDPDHPGSLIPDRKYREALDYLEPVIKSKHYIGSMDEALSLAMHCYRGIGKPKKAEQMQLKLIKDYPGSEIAKYEKSERDKQRKFREFLDESMSLEEYLDEVKDDKDDE